MIGRLLFLIGLPRSGKSHVANWLVEKEHNTIIVCADDIRLALHGMRWSSVAEPMVHAIKDVMIRAALNRGQNVIVDGTHTTAKSIKELFYINSDATFLKILTTADECKRRASMTHQEDLFPVIDRMSKQLSELTDEVIEQIRQEVKNNPITPRINQ